MGESVGFTGSHFKLDKQCQDASRLTEVCSLAELTPTIIAEPSLSLSVVMYVASKSKPPRTLGTAFTRHEEDQRKRKANLLGRREPRLRSALTLGSILNGIDDDQADDPAKREGEKKCSLARVCLKATKRTDDRLARRSTGPQRTCLDGFLGMCASSYSDAPHSGSGASKFRGVLFSTNNFSDSCYFIDLFDFPSSRCAFPVFVFVFFSFFFLYFNSPRCEQIRYSTHGVLCVGCSDI